MQNTFVITLVAFFLFISCTKSKTNAQPQNSNEIIHSDFKIVEVSQPTILSHHIDSLGLIQLIDKYGEEDTSTVFEHLNMYNFEMQTLADTLGIHVKEFNDRKIAIRYGQKTFNHIQDTAAGYHSHFYYDGDTIRKLGILQIIDILKHNKERISN